jgi:hypothetical protein
MSEGSDAATAASKAAPAVVLASLLPVT